MKTPLFDNTPQPGAHNKLLPWKINCDALTTQDWDWVADTMINMMPEKTYSSVYGVPTGGNPIARAIRKRHDPTPGAEILIVDDVITTGKSISILRNKLIQDGASKDGIIALALFDRRNPFRAAEQGTDFYAWGIWELGNQRWMT